jgi:hypothetical protein
LSRQAKERPGIIKQGRTIEKPIKKAQVFKPKHAAQTPARKNGVQTALVIFLMDYLAV